MNPFTLCGIALLAYAAIEIVGKEEPRIGAVIGAVGAICLLLPSILSLSGVFGALKEALTNYHFIGGDTLFRAFGIGLCCEITGDVLRDAGRQGLANALDLSCKAAILLLCVPLWRELFKIVGEFVS